MGRVIGTAGYGVAHGDTWAASKQAQSAGLRGERRTAAVLDRHARNSGAVVLHDLAIPIRGIPANVDHAVVSGRTVLFIDSKLWRPGFYWSFAGHHLRGLSGVAHTGGKTMAMARDAYRPLLGGARLATPLVVVWPSVKDAAVSLWALRLPGAKFIRGDQLESRLRTLVEPADERIVFMLSGQVADPNPVRPAAAGTPLLESDF